MPSCAAHWRSTSPQGQTQGDYQGDDQPAVRVKQFRRGKVRGRLFPAKLALGGGASAPIGLAAYQPGGQGPRHQASGDEAQGGAGHADLQGTLQPLGGGGLGPGGGGAMAAEKGDAAEEEAQAFIQAETAGNGHAGQVLQADDDDDGETDDGHPQATPKEGGELGRQAHPNEEHQEQGLADVIGKVDLDAKSLARGGDQSGDEQATRNGGGNIPLP
jgi:hypothetical protein